MTLRAVPRELFSASGAAAESPEDFFFIRNVEFAVGTQSSTAEPSVANKGNVVMMTGNWYAALSTDGGRTFDYIDPFSGPFRIPEGETFCCDQAVIYDAKHDAFFWYEQFDKGDAGNTVRVNVDIGADGDFDCAYDDDSASLGLDGELFLDFPDIAVSDEFLYESTNVFGLGESGGAQGAVLARTRLDDIANCAQSPRYQVYADPEQQSFRFTQGAGPVMYWGSHSLRNWAIRIYRWPDDAAQPTFDETPIDPFNSPGGGTARCPGPDGRDWCGKSDSRILGAYLANGVIGFMWNAAQGGDIPYPYVQMARFRESDRSLIDQPRFQYDQGAYQYPSVAVNARGDLGGTVMFGGGEDYPSCVAWIADDISAQSAGTDFTDALYFVVHGAYGPDENRMGDYLASRAHFPFTNTWIGSCYSMQEGSANGDAHTNFAWFGRRRDDPSAPVTPTSRRPQTPTRTPTAQIRTPTRTPTRSPSPTPVGPPQATLQVGSASIAPGQQGARIPILMDNAVVVRALQFTLTDVPDEVSLASARCAVAARASGLTCDANQVGNAIRVAMISTGTARIAPGSGEVAAVFVDDTAPACSAGTTVALALSDTTIGDANSLPVPHVVHNGVLQCGCRGELNQSGRTDIIDALHCVDFVIGRVNPSPIEQQLADLSCDGRIDILDCLRILDVVLGRQPPCPSCPGGS